MSKLLLLRKCAMTSTSVLHNNKQNNRVPHKHDITAGVHCVRIVGEHDLEEASGAGLLGGIAKGIQPHQLGASCAQ